MSSDNLSPREKEVLEWIACGLSDDAIAERLCLERKSVQRHVYSIYAKLDAPQGSHQRVYATLMWRGWSSPLEAVASDGGRQELSG